MLDSVSGPSVPFRRYGLVNLLELLRFYAEPFLTLSAQMASLQETVNTISATTRNKKLAKLFPNGLPASEVETLADVRSLCTKLGLSSSLRQFDRLEDVFKNENTTLAQLVAAFTELRVRISDEMEQALLFHVPISRARYFESPKFSDSVTVAFPSATLDIEEAGKCFALGRWTACVFHLMRVTEHGLRALATYLGVPCDFKTWDPIIRKMRTEVEDYNASTFKGNLDFIRQTLERLTGVQLALRNEIMHARSFYDEERAEDIYRAVRIFMEQLATQLKGAP
jgi:hypothetical protein